MDARMCSGRITHLLVSAGLALMVAGSSAVAQSKDGQQGQPGDVLRGPDVRDNSVPGQRNKFGGGNAREKGQARDATPPRMFVQALAVLRGENVAEGAKLTSEQEDSLKKLQQQFRDEQRAFAEKHKDEIVQLREKLSPEARRKVDQRLRAIMGPGMAENRGKPGDRPGNKSSDKPLGKPDRDPSPDDAMQDKPTGDDAAALNRLRELAEQAPDAAAMQTKAWNVLNPTQKELVEKEMKRLREEGGRERPGAREGAGPGLPPGAIGKDGKVDLSKLPPRLRERIEKLPADEQAKALERLAEQERQRGGKNNRSRPKDAPADGGDSSQPK